MSPRTGFIMRGFLPGLGILTVSRGLGGFTDTEIFFPGPARAKEGGFAPRAVKVRRPKPDIIVARGTRKLPPQTGVPSRASVRKQRRPDILSARKPKK